MSADTLRRAAQLMRERAEAATPGPWERPLDTRYKNSVIAALPDGEEPRSWRGGVIPANLADQPGPTGRYAGQRERVSVVAAAIWSVGGFMRKRSGRDLEHIAGMHPLVALAVAEWLETVASDLDAVPAACFPIYSPDPALKVARAYLGEQE